jgi:hypothetical protein
MAHTYTWADALARVASQGFRATEDSQAVFSCNDAQFLIWDAYDWRSTLEVLPPFWIIGNEQDYGRPMYAVPEDLQALRKAYLVNTYSNYNREDLQVKRDIALTNMRTLPRTVGYVQEEDCMRVWPRPPEGTCPTQYLIDGVYKKRPTKVTTANMGSSLLPWDDKYFRVVCTALQWSLTSETSQNKSPLFAVAMGQIHDMADKEGLDLGDPQGVAPVEPLVRAWGVRY